MNENRFNLRADVWTSFDEEQQSLFNRVIEKELSRKNAIIQSVSPDCRPNLEEYFNEVIINIVGDVIQQTHMELT